MKKKNGVLATPTKPYKIILLGDANCGKSSLLTRYIRRTFTDVSRRLTSY